MKHSIQLTPEAAHSYKIGMNEIVGLEAAMRDVFQPVADFLNEQESWSGDDWFKIETAEYKSRDGFIADSHNYGGLQIHTVIPKCGEYDFAWLDFGEYSEREDGMTDEEYDSQRESEESEGHLDAGLRIWFKFEGIADDGALEFYLVCAGGNGDAPYFRPKYEQTYFEASFSCKSVAGLKRAALKHIKALLKIIS